MKDLNNTLDKKFNEFINKQLKSEKDIQSTVKKSNGIYLTNSNKVIDLILEYVPKDNTIFLKTFLEPSCGEGIFILRLILNAYFIDKNINIISKFIENIYFIDINPDMVLKTENNIKDLFYFLFKKPYKGKLNKYCMDFTLKQKSLFQTDNFLNLYKKFDFIIGNPPYISLYGRRDKKKNENQRIYYLKNYDQFPESVTNGKINYIMLFLEHSLSFLKERGTLSFIIDISFFETAYLFCRKYLLENTKIKKLIYNIQEFENAVSGQIIISLIKEKVKHNDVLLLDYDNDKKQSIDQYEWYNKDEEYKFKIPIPKKIKNILDKVKSKYSLKELYPDKNLRTCTMLLNMENKFLNNVSGFPYYQGSKSIKTKYSIPVYDKYFNYDKKLQDKINDELKIKLEKEGIKNKKRIGLGELIIYKNPKLFIRQSSSELISTYDENYSSANNSLYVFSLRSDSIKSKIILKYICGLFNSTIYTFIAQQTNIIRNTKGKQPQIKLSDLYKIPIPKNKNLKLEISKLVTLIYNDPTNKKLKIKIDKLLYDYFNLSKEEIEIINDIKDRR